MTKEITVNVSFYVDDEKDEKAQVLSAFMEILEDVVERGNCVTLAKLGEIEIFGEKGFSKEYFGNALSVKNNADA